MNADDPTVPDQTVPDQTVPDQTVPDQTVPDPTVPDPVIEVFADIWCPFAHVGLREVRRQRDLSGHGHIAMVVRAWPLELINGRPQDARATQVHIDELHEHAAPEMLCHLETEAFPTSTLEALALVSRAYRVDVALGERLSFELRDAMFERGQDISDPAVLRQYADAAGLDGPDDADRAAVLAEWHDGQARGVIGSPHFFCGDAQAFCPSLEITRAPDSGLTISLYTARLRDFLESYFATVDADAS